MSDQNLQENPPAEKKRKHLILYILDIPYFVIYVVFYKILASAFYIPLFILLNGIQVSCFLSLMMMVLDDFIRLRQ